MLFTSDEIEKKVCHCCKEAREKNKEFPRPLHFFPIPKMRKEKAVIFKKSFPLAICVYCDGEAYKMIKTREKK